MSKYADYTMAKEIMGDGFIGIDELKRIKELDFIYPTNVPTIPFTVEELKEKREDYFLILGIDRLSDGAEVSIKTLISVFGKNPDASEPCFYNQDWYDKEAFVDVPIKSGWFMIRRSVYDDSRAIQPQDLLRRYIFPSAINCTYAFFVVWRAKGVKLWYHDFVWCSDTDHNGDRIYVGKYHDIDGVNKNGFSIHRHLALRPCYGCID